MIRVSYDKELDAAIGAVEGDVNKAELIGAIEAYYKGALTKYTIVDFTRANPVKHFTSEELKDISARTALLGKARPEGFNVIIVPRVVQFAVARVYCAYCEMTSKDVRKPRTKIFRSRAEAMAFIRKNHASGKK